jgi:hypothetical protein
VTARHRNNPSPDQARVRLLVLVMLVALGVGAAFFRGPASEDQVPEDSVPSAGGTTTTGLTGTTVEGPSDSTLPGTDLPPLQEVRLELVYDLATDINNAQPVDLGAPVGDDRLFLVRRLGEIRILDEDRQLVSPAFLDLTDRVNSGGIERGLLGLAFHPDYADNGRFFVYYTTNQVRRLSEFRVAATDPSRAIADSEKVIFEFPHPVNAVEPRHYAGQVAFDPDGLLWVSLGDGADSRAQGQDPNTIFGTIVRIDVDNGDPYVVPSDNPFVEGGGKAEVWAYGLRNPWRFAIDPVDRLIYIGDVGHDQQEEINVVPIDDGGGYNFGWSDMEGTRCFHKQDCVPDDYTSPVLTYTRDLGFSVTGGRVYRGSEIPELAGTYFYSDYVEGWIKSFRYVDGQVTDERDWTDQLGGAPGQVVTFGFDGHGELYLTTFGGQVYKFTASR